MKEDRPSRGYDDLPDRVDAVIIGAGLGGLTCALDLARQGLSVCVLEQHRVAGGYAHAFRRRGYHFDVSLRYIGGLAPGQMLHAVLNTLGVYEKLPLHRRETLLTAEFPGERFVLPNDQAQLIDELVRLSPGTAEALTELFAYLRAIKRHALGPWIEADFDVPIDQRLNVQHRADTFTQVLEKFIRDPKLIALLGQLWMFIGLPPSSASATFTAGLFVSSYLDGIYDVEGGGAAITRAMVDRLRELGAACVTRTPVARILLDGQVAVGVETSRGDVVEAPVVVSNANPYQTFFELIPGDEPSKLYRFRLQHMKPSCSLYSTYLGLDCSTDELDIPKGNYFSNASYDYEEAWKLARAGEIDRTDWCLVNYESYGSGIFPRDTGIVALAEPTTAGEWLDIDDETYHDRKRRVRDRLFKKYCQRFPGLADHVKVHEFGTPRTMVRYTRNHQGAVFGLAQTPEQSGSRRLRNRTPIDGLFLTGAWTWAGGGYEGAIMSGIQSADSVLRSLDSPRAAPPVSLHVTADESNAPRPDDQFEDAPPDLSRYPHSLLVRVYGDDLNSRGFAGAPTLVRYMDRARYHAIEEVCEQAGVESWMDTHIVNVYRIDAHGRPSARMNHVLDMRTALRPLTSHRAAFDQVAINTTTGDIVVVATVEVLFLNQDRVLVPVPDSFPSAPSAGNILPQKRREHVEFSDDSAFPFRSRFRVYYEDTDMQQITFHAAYVRFCERALFDLTRTAWPEMPMTTWTAKNRINVSRMDIRYLKATKCGDWLEVRTGARQLDPYRIAFDQRIVLAETGQVVADAITDVESRDLDERVAPIPAQLVDTYYESLPPSVDRR